MFEDEFIPGTSQLIQSTTQVNTYSLRKSGTVVLSPQPSNSPNDPLNWSLERKLWHTFLLCFLTGLTAATTNDFGFTEDNLRDELGITTESIDSAESVVYVGIGCWTFLMSPVASIYGRRLPYLICIFLGVLGKIWMSLEKNSQDMIWNQLFVGTSEAVAEATVQLSLSEIWFEHQRGGILGIYVLMTSVGTFLGPLIGGFVVDNLGWRWVARLSLITTSITLVIFYFGLEETLFDRYIYLHNPNSIIGSNKYPDISRENDFLPKPARGEQFKHDYRASLNTQPENSKSYWKRIKLVTRAPNLNKTGIKQYLSRLLHTLQIFAFPAVFYSGFQWGAQDAWLSFYLKLQEEEWSQQPFNYSKSQSALMNIPTIIGAIIGCFWGGFLADQLVLHIAKRRNGITEAEDRLWMMLPSIIISPAGLIVFGIGTAEGWRWNWPYVGLGMIGFGWGCAGDLSMSYLMDAYPEVILEGMVGVSIINNTIGCIFTYISSSWLKYSGVRSCMIGVGCLSLLFFLLTLPMIMWGKCCRRWTTTRYRDFVKSRDAI